MSENYFSFFWKPTLNVEDSWWKGKLRHCGWTFRFAIGSFPSMVLYLPIRFQLGAHLESDWVHVCDENTENLLIFCKHVINWLPTFDFKVYSKSGWIEGFRCFTTTVILISNAWSFVKHKHYRASISNQGFSLTKVHCTLAFTIPLGGPFIPFIAIQFEW
jgi:hypothetical protein